MACSKPLNTALGLPDASLSPTLPNSDLALPHRLRSVPCDAVDEMPELTTHQLAENLRTKKNFVWLDSLMPEACFPNQPHLEGLSLLAVEPDLLLQGTMQDLPLLEKELERRTLCALGETNSLGAAIGFFRYDGSFCFGFYETVYRHYAGKNESYWLTPPPQIKLPQAPEIALKKSLHFKSDLTAAEYCEKVQQAQDYIKEGDIYQVCLAHRFTAPCTENPWPLYLALRKKSPAPFSAYLHLAEEAILSSSPECFLKIQDRHIVTRPIKGTRPRRNDPTEDEQQALELKASQKENAELIMITDLERNDLGKICDYGSIVTSQLLHLESYPQVFHLVSTIEGRLRSNVSHPVALAACFPGGSISGVPKKRALEIIQKLEKTPRGIFSGAIGYFGFDGTSQFSIAIRTMRLHGKIAEFHVGSGITSDSRPEEEWEETLHKASGILAAGRCENS